MELERMNGATDDINKLEKELDVCIAVQKCLKNGNKNYPVALCWITSSWHISDFSKSDTTIGPIALWIQHWFVLFGYIPYHSHYHLMFQEARGKFRKTLSEASRTLNMLLKKHKRSIEKSREYYQILVKSKKVRTEDVVTMTFFSNSALFVRGLAFYLG